MNANENASPIVTLYHQVVGTVGITTSCRLCITLIFVRQYHVHQTEDIWVMQRAISLFQLCLRSGRVERRSASGVATVEGPTAELLILLLGPSDRILIQFNHSG